MNCPKCGVAIDTTDLARSLASKGGKAGRGRSKARTEDQARAAARVRWDKVKLEKLRIVGSGSVQQSLTTLAKGADYL